MDINYFLEREQVERVRADSAECAHSRAAHLGLAEGYRRLIDSHRAGASGRLPGQAD